jgi:hypothetical protein
MTLSYFPTSQRLQSENDELPITFENVPTGQLMHAACEDVGLYVPGKHESQVPAPAFENLPTSHDIHTEDFQLPVLLLYLPAPHEIQSDTLSPVVLPQSKLTPYLPIGHALHPDLSALE